MELYILDNRNLDTLSVVTCSDYEINLDEETNAKSTFRISKKVSKDELVGVDFTLDSIIEDEIFSNGLNGLQKGNYIVLNGLYRQFLFIIDDVTFESKDANFVDITALDISNIFNRKIIKTDTEMMTTNSIEEFIQKMIEDNFINSDDAFVNMDYIEVSHTTTTQGIVTINDESGIYNFHTFITNCGQYKGVYLTYLFENHKLKITIAHRTQSTKIIDTTLKEVTNFTEVYKADVVAKVTVYITSTGTTYNRYLLSDRTTTTDATNPLRASGTIEVISVENPEEAETEAINTFKSNTYNHLVEFQLKKTSKLIDVTTLEIGTPVEIKTETGVYESVISAISLSDDNFISYKSGNFRIDFIDKIKKEKL